MREFALGHTAELGGAEIGLLNYHPQRTGAALHDVLDRVHGRLVPV